jgi:glycerol dehydrogenase
MNKVALFPGKYIQGAGVLTQLPELIKSLGNKALMLASPTIKNTVLPAFPDTFVHDRLTIDAFKGECCEEELERVALLFREIDADIMIGMGGGKTIDTAKIVADRVGKPVIIIPTIASSDAPCSGCAVAYNRSGHFEKVYYQKMNPAIVLVDMNIIAAAPARFLVSGMGDALATWFEARSCKTTNSMNECGGTSLLAGMQLARLCYETLIKQGVTAKKDNAANRITPALEDITEANILLSGIGFESGGLAAAHAVHNGLTMLEETHGFYHGEKVAFGVITGLHLTSAAAEEINQVYGFCEVVGLPTTLASIGIHEPLPEKLMQVAIKATEPGSSIHHEAMKVTPEKVVEAMVKANLTGKERE